MELAALFVKAEPHSSALSKEILHGMSHRRLGGEISNVLPLAIFVGDSLDAPAIGVRLAAMFEGFSGNLGNLASKKRLTGATPDHPRSFECHQSATSERLCVHIRTLSQSWSNSQLVLSRDIHEPEKTPRSVLQLRLPV